MKNNKVEKKLFGVSIESEDGEEWRGLLDEPTLTKLTELADQLSDEANV